MPARHKANTSRRRATHKSGGGDVAALPIIVFVLYAFHGEAQLEHHRLPHSKPSSLATPDIAPHQMLLFQPAGLDQGSTGYSISQTADGRATRRTPPCFNKSRQVHDEQRKKSPQSALNELHAKRISIVIEAVWRPQGIAPARKAKPPNVAQQAKKYHDKQLSSLADHATGNGRARTQPHCESDAIFCAKCTQSRGSAAHSRARLPPSAHVNRLPKVVPANRHAMRDRR